MKCPHCDNSDPALMLSHEVQGIYDGVLFWSCTSCGRAWSRDWSDRPRIQQIADEYVRQFNDHADASP